MDFWIYIENLLDWKIKYIRSGRVLRNNEFDKWFKATIISLEPLFPYIL